MYPVQCTETRAHCKVWLARFFGGIEFVMGHSSCITSGGIFCSRMIILYNGAMGDLLTQKLALINVFLLTITRYYSFFIRLKNI